MQQHTNQCKASSYVTVNAVTVNAEASESFTLTSTPQFVQ